MLKTIKTHSLVASAALTSVLLTSNVAHATNFSTFASNFTTSIQDFPKVISPVSYLAGMLFIVLGVLKIKDHVENPTQTPIREGAIRLGAGGACLVIPVIATAAINSLGGTSTVTQSSISALSF